jgi:hypothetical protein
MESGAAITAPPIPDETGKKAIAFTFVMFVPFQYQNVIIEIYCLMKIYRRISNQLT